MRIVIVGAGKVGEALCRDLSDEGNDIVLIEEDQFRLEHVMDVSDITGIVGNGASYDVQMEASVDKADIFLAVTEADELNIIACIVAKKIGAVNTIARVRNPDYSRNMTFLKDNLGVSFMINPEEESAVDIMNSLKYPSAYSVDNFMNNKVNMVQFDVEKNSPLDNLRLRDFHMTTEKVLICAVLRDDEITIPDGNFILKAGDKIHVTGTQRGLKEFIIKCNYENGIVKSVMIIGGSRIAFYLVERLLEKRIRVKLIEQSEDRAAIFAERFPSLEVILGDGTDQELLLEEGIDRFDAVVSLTGIDEENIIISMFAITEGVPKNITKINRNFVKPIVDKLELDTIITPKKIIADKIIRFVRSRINSKGSSLENFRRIIGGKVEAIHFTLKKDSKALNIPLKDLKTVPNLLIACIKRGSEIIYPGGNDVMKKGDEVLVVTKTKYIDEFDDILVRHE
ncbi:MAG: Trk system potassium transporter TrkA [Firmicutes bacterium]|nr:Trk system potassium transporter TrkA [Bacillota bacterium]